MLSDNNEGFTKIGDIKQIFFWQAHTHKHTPTDIYKNIAC